MNCPNPIIRQLCSPHDNNQKIMILKSMLNERDPAVLISLSTGEHGKKKDVMCQLEKRNAVINFRFRGVNNKQIQRIFKIIST